MSDTNDYRTLILTLDPAFQGLPDTAHGGAVLAAFDALAGLSTPREVTGLYKKRVPLATPLALAAGNADGAHTFVLRDEDGTVLVDGRVASLAAAVAAGHPLPISRACYACGIDNPLGLRVQLEFDDVEVRGTWWPRESFRTADGTLATAALTTLCDEAAFWIGALATGESGMTTDLCVTLHRAVDFGGAITVAGARASARPQADPRYWDTAVVARAEDGALVASARITFVAVRGAARRLVTGMLAINAPPVVGRVFPAYAR